MFVAIDMQELAHNKNMLEVNKSKNRYEFVSYLVFLLLLTYKYTCGKPNGCYLEYNIIHEATQIKNNLNKLSLLLILTVTVKTFLLVGDFNAEFQSLA